MKKSFRNESTNSPRVPVNPPTPMSSNTNTVELEKKLQSQEFYIAELVDEISFQEKAVESHAAELQTWKLRFIVSDEILQDLLGYLLSLETSVIIPALGSLSEILPETKMELQRAENLSKLQKLEGLSTRTAKLILSLEKPPSAIIERFKRKRESILASKVSELSLEDVYVLCELLQDAQEELRVLIRDAVDRAKGIFPSTVFSSSSSMSSPQLEELKLKCEAQELELQKSNKLVAAIQQDRKVLLEKLQTVQDERKVSVGPSLEALQQQHGAEKEALQKKVRALEAIDEEGQRTRKEQLLKMEDLQHTCEQLRQEKLLLLQDLSALQALNGHSNNGTLASVPIRKDEGDLVAFPNFTPTQTLQQRRPVSSADVRSGMVADDCSTPFGQQSNATTDARQSNAPASIPKLYMQQQQFQRKPPSQQQQQQQREEESHQLRLEMEKVTREHSSLVTHLETQLAELRGELLSAKNVVSTADAERCSHLQKMNETLLRELSQLQEKMLSSALQQQDTTLFDRKIENFENTIAALTEELTVCEAKIAEVEKHYVEERRKLVSGFDLERKRFQEELQHCDVLVLKMSNEFELVVQENNQLRLELAKYADSCEEEKKS